MLDRADRGLGGGGGGCIIDGAFSYDGHTYGMDLVTPEDALYVLMFVSALDAEEVFQEHLPSGAFQTEHHLLE